MCRCKEDWITGMLSGNGKLRGLSTTNVCGRDGDVLLWNNIRRWVTHKGSFATQNKTYINITTIYVKSMG